MRMSGFADMYVCAPYVCLVPTAVRSPETRGTDGCELPLVCWELNSGPLQESASSLSHLSSYESDTGHFVPQVI